MTTATVVNTIQKIERTDWPETTLEAATFLARAEDYVKHPRPAPDNRWIYVDYHDQKSAQLFSALSDKLLAEVRIEAWRADLGVNGCQTKET